MFERGESQSLDDGGPFGSKTQSDVSLWSSWAERAATTRRPGPDVEDPGFGGNPRIFFSFIFNKKLKYEYRYVNESERRPSMRRE